MTICQLAAWARAFEITEMPFRLIKRVWHQLDALKRNSRFAQPTRLIFAKRTAERAEVANIQERLRGGQIHQPK